MQDLKDIRSLSLEQLEAFFVSIQEPSFRAKQVYEWIWKKSAQHFDDMTNLSLSLREKLKQHFVFKALYLADLQVSQDGTLKAAFKLHDDYVVEGVLIPTDTRMTACVSSQVGCSLTCAFCATGKLERKRNLSAAEIYDQVVALRDMALEKYNKPLSNIVYMGMGEPLLNYASVIEASEKITSPQGLGMSPNRITLSTAGIAKMIQKMADDGVRFNLALSLHAANDQKRNKIMPINESNTLDTLISALTYFYQKTRTRPTLEYIIFKNFNDSLQDAQELAHFCKKVPVKVNIIEYNSIGDPQFQQASTEKVNAFAQFLEKAGVIVNVRRSRGKDIDAACGQLANKNKAITV